MIPRPFSKVFTTGSVRNDDALLLPFITESGYPETWKQAEMRLPLIALFSLGFLQNFAQNKSISITIDDVPNTVMYREEGFRPVLLDKLDSLEVPFTVFINEGKIYQTDLVDKNKDLLERWITSNYSLPGNHTYSHLRYSEVGFEAFVQDVSKGSRLTDSLASVVNRSVPFFRFPFNDLGLDSVQHSRIKEHLHSEGYVIAPFTVECSDWMFNAVYRHYLDSGEEARADSIGREYVRQTMEQLRFFESMALAVYGREVNHILLCHDNAINAVYLVDILNALKEEGYVIEGLDQSLTDPIYSLPDRYFRKWGVSWLYRFMEARQERISWMRREPALTRLEEEYNSIVGE